VSDERPRSVAFDRAAAFYDASRETESDQTRREADLVLSELADREHVLEIGTGTGAIGLLLHTAGVHVVAIDLSMPMLARLIERAGGEPSLALVQADATRMPFRDRGFDAAVARWVFHLIPDWPAALAEVARVVRPGGVFLINAGGVYQGAWGEIRDRMGQEVGRELRPAGLAWRDFDALDAESERLGMRPRPLAPIAREAEEPLGVFLEGIERNHFSWLWPLPDDQRLRAAAVVRRWAEERFGPLDRPMPMRVDALWRAYDLADGGRSPDRAR
jgi:SAM-dependent methyltransferase